jgi:hypothetical protein
MTGLKHCNAELVEVLTDPDLTSMFKVADILDLL